MSDDSGLEGWSIVRHIDDVGSDADSVEVISDDSDRETCDEGKDACDEEHKIEAADSTMEEATSVSGGEEEVGTTDEGDLDSDLVRLDPLGDLTQRLSNKLHEFLLVPRHIHNDRSHQDLKLRYVVIASTLLALICSLLVSSYLLFHKFQELPEKRDDSTSAQVLQELEQAISRLQSVLRLENKQHLKDSLSKMPPDNWSLDKMVSNGGFNKRKPLKRSHAIPTVENEDFGVIKSFEETREINSDRHEDNSKKIFYPKDEKLPVSLDYRAEKSPGQKENEENDGIDQAKSLDKIINMPLLTDLPSNTKTSDDPHNLTKAEILTTDTPAPAQVESKTHESFYDIKSDNHITSSKDSEILDSDAKDVLLSIRQDVLSVQNQLYSQIMNSLFEYKIDLYKNLLRAGLDSTCNADHSNKKSNHKKFMLIRNLQNMISKSSESNFESWYKFYSYSISPRFRTIVNKLDSITNERGRETKSTAKNGVTDKVKPQQSATSDDFFIRSSVPYGVSDYEAIQPAASDGFDWKNLDNKIKESMNKARITSKEQPVVKNQEKITAVDENRSSDNKPSSGNNKYNNFVENSEKQNGGKIYNGEKAFEESPTARSERSSRREERQKTRGQSEGRMQERTKNKQEKSTFKHDRTNDDISEFSKEDSKTNFEKDNGVGNGNFEKNKKSGDEFVKENVKYEQRDRKSGGTKERFGKEYCSGGRCDKGDGKDYYFHDGRPRRKSFLNNMTKYVKKAASGLWKTVRGGFKKVKNYGSYIKDWHTGEDKGKGNYEEWRKEFVKEMKDVIRVLGGNPAINGLYELPKSVTKFFGDGLGNLMNTEREWDEEVDVEGVRKGPAGVKLDECNPNESEDKLGSYGMCSPDDSEDVKEDNRKKEDKELDKASWYAEAAKHRAKSRGESYPSARPRPADSSWFLGLSRHRAYLRRRGVHLDDDGSWFISSARHRAKMRQRHTDYPQLPPHFVQASSKRGCACHLQVDKERAESRSRNMLEKKASKTHGDGVLRAQALRAVGRPAECDTRGSQEAMWPKEQGTHQGVTSPVQNLTLNERIRREVCSLPPRHPTPSLMTSSIVSCSSIFSSDKGDLSSDKGDLSSDKGDEDQLTTDTGANEKTQPIADDESPNEEDLWRSDGI